MCISDSASGVLSVDVWMDFLKVLGCAPKKEKTKEVRFTHVTEVDPDATEVKEKEDTMTISTVSTTSTVSVCSESLVQPPISHVRRLCVIHFSELSVGA